MDSEGQLQVIVRLSRQKLLCDAPDLKDKARDKEVTLCTPLGSCVPGINGQKEGVATVTGGPAQVTVGESD